ncbi:hypothetical protein MKW92_051748 [Papaver armeniacum]|nr:hypothetical protein MKW92_051748 [Papaver armeniacum]
MPKRRLVATIIAASTPALVFGYYLGNALLLLHNVSWMYFVELGAMTYGGYGLVYFTKKCGPLTSIAIANSAFIFLVPLLVGSLPHHDMKQLFFGLISVGSAGAACVVYLTIYVSEISPPKIRGAFVSTIFCQIAGGQILYHLLKLLNSSSRLHLEEVEIWHWMLAIVVPVIHLTYLMGGALPESPIWLYRNVSSEVKSMELSLSMEEAEEEQDKKEKELERVCWYPFAFPWYMVPSRRIIAGYGLFVAQQFVGLNMMTHYSYTILHLTTNRYSRKTENIMTTAALEIPLIQSSLVLIGTLICTILVDRLGRRRLLLISISGIILSLNGLKLPFSSIMGAVVEDDNRLVWYNIAQERASGMGLLALAALAMYMISYSLGIGTVPWIINSELYPMKYRYNCVIMGSVAYWMAKQLVEVFFLDNLGRYFSVADMLFLLCLFSLAVGTFIYFYIPETKGLRLEDVEKVLLQQDKQLKLDEYRNSNHKEGQKSDEEEFEVLL